MQEIQNIQWFPGHMTKTRRQIEKCLPLVDAVVEIADARIPASSRNPDLAGIVVNKPRLLLLNKCDVADPSATSQWIEKVSSEGIPTLAVDCRSGKGLSAFIPAVSDLLKERTERLAAKGMVAPRLRVMVVGIPNVGKSSFINRMAGKGKAKVEDRPGVTRGNQWFTVGKNIDLLDTPGVLWPKFDDMAVGERLAFTGAVKDEVTDTVWLSYRLLGFLSENYPQLLSDRYKLNLDSLSSVEEIFEKIARSRGMLMSGGVVNDERCAAMLLDEFRGGKIGRITLELPGGADNA